MVLYHIHWITFFSMGCWLLWLNRNNSTFSSNQSLCSIKKKEKIVIYKIIEFVSCNKLKSVTETKRQSSFSDFIKLKTRVELWRSKKGTGDLFRNRQEKNSQIFKMNFYLAVQLKYWKTRYWHIFKNYNYVNKRQINFLIMLTLFLIAGH